jgi:hypothetical protein
MEPPFIFCVASEQQASVYINISAIGAVYTRAKSLFVKGAS